MEDEYDEDLQQALQLSLQESLGNPQPQQQPLQPTEVSSVPTPPQVSSAPTPVSGPLPEAQLLQYFSMFSSPSVEEYKMVLVVRVDLGMTKGKMCAQCGHATLGAYKQAIGSQDLRKWEQMGEAKIALKVNSEQEMLDLARKCELSGLNHYIVADAGRTQIKSGSLTVLSIGPAPKSKIDAITGSLKLL